MTKSILITGCSSGIGYDAARTLAQRDWHVFATCRQEADCERLRAEGLESFRLDYEDEASIRAAMSEVTERTGGSLDALFNNGAYAIPAASEDLPRNALRAIFEANLFGWHDLTCQAIKLMRSQGHGRIVMNSSVLGLVPMPWRGAYVATKFALEGLTDTMRVEMAGTGIKLISIEPGPVTSDIRKNATKQFEKHIDWQSSARRAQYENSLLKRLYADTGKDAFELPASAVTKKLIHAIEASRPRPRYYVTTPTYIMGAARRLLPTRGLDWLISRAG